MADQDWTVVEAKARRLLDDVDPASTPRLEFLRERFDAGLAWVHYPIGLGGLGMHRRHQAALEEVLAEAGAPDHNPAANSIGLGMAAPTILAHGTTEQHARFLRPLWTGEEVWCQLFSEPGAGSDLAGVRTRAVLQDGTWTVDGQKVWTSGAHLAHFAILLARTAPERPKHQGLTYFLCDMRQEGVEVRPLRQITGEAEFNEVFLTGAKIPDAHRLGDEGDGWRVAHTTLNNERVSIGGGSVPRESGMIGAVAATWREGAGPRDAAMLDRLLRLWVDAEAARIAGIGATQKLAAGQPGPEGAALKLSFARIAQELSGLELELLAEDGLRYSEWAESAPAGVDMLGAHAGYRYLRAKGNSIEGGTSEVLRNIVSERVLGLPVERRVDAGIPWKDIPR